MLESFITSLAPEILVSLFQQFSNWFHDLEEVWNEPTIIASQPKETSYLGHCCWQISFQDTFHLTAVHCNSLRWNHVTQEWYFLDPELTLAEFGIHLVIS
jgi:hypothetical protein